MARIKLSSVVLALALVVAVTACSSSSKSSSSTSSSAGGGVSVTTPAAGNTVDIVVSDSKGLDGPMTLVATPNAGKAGDVTFVVKNTGTIEHEVVVLPLPTGTTYDKMTVETTGADADKVSEDGSLGETGDPAVQPGETRTFTVKAMPAGNYALVCNIAKHYAMGMRAPFTVT